MTERLHINLDVSLDIMHCYKCGLVYGYEGHSFRARTTPTKQKCPHCSARTQDYLAEQLAASQRSNAALRGANRRLRDQLKRERAGQ